MALGDAAIATAIAALSLVLIAFLGYLGGFIATILIIGAVATYIGKSTPTTEGARKGHPIVGAIALFLILYLVLTAALRNGIASLLIAALIVIIIALIRGRGRSARYAYA